MRMCNFEDMVLDVDFYGVDDGSLHWDCAGEDCPQCNPASGEDAEER